MTIKGCRLIITRSSENLIREIQNYRWKKDKNDKVLEEPVKADDHAVDSLRYAIHSHQSAFRINFYGI